MGGLLLGLLHVVADIHNRSVTASENYTRLQYTWLRLLRNDWISHLPKAFKCHLMRALQVVETSRTSSCSSST